MNNDPVCSMSKHDNIKIEMKKREKIMLLFSENTEFK